MEVEVTQSCPTLCHPMNYSPTRPLCPWNSPGKNIGVGFHALLQGIFLTQGSNLGLLHCRQILYHLSHQGSPAGEKLSHYSGYTPRFPILVITSLCSRVGTKRIRSISPDSFPHPSVVTSSVSYSSGNWESGEIKKLPEPFWELTQESRKEFALHY